MKHMIYLVAITMMISMWSCSDGPAHKEGEVYYGFKLIENRFVEEVNANCLYFEHEKSGARLMKIAADDANKVFAVSFKTLPQHDYGTPHIIEHSVLNGSENFPAKSPFDILRKGSLNTFLNAMTWPDYTAYPIASMNNKDYFNLMHVYMDAVFNPLLHSDPRILEQEGWHYELDDVDGEITYKGVVYNEMKGAFSNPERQMDYHTYKVLFPDNTYGVSSGGYPDAIPELTYDYFKNFHKTYYHPSNSFIFLYGDADLDKELEFLNSEYLSNYEKQEKKLEVPLQEPFSEKKTLEETYSVPEGSDTNDKTFLGYYYVAGLTTDHELTMALDIISEALVNHESAPLRLALQEAGIGKDIYAYVDDSKQNIFQFIVQNANPEDREKFQEVVSETLHTVAQKGFEEEMIEGIVNRMEFRLREGDSPYKGLIYLFSLKNSFLFAEDIYDGIEFEKPLAAVKEGIKNGILQQIVQDYFIDNPHALMMVFKPEPGLEKKMSEQTKAKLADYKASLSDEELQKLVEKTKALKEYQQAEDSPEAVATIPMLSRSDISNDVQWYEVAEKSISDIPVLHYEDFTNDIVYANFFFDLRPLPQELIPYANLMSQLLGKMNTENYDFGELDNALNIHTGGFYTYLSTYLENNSDENLIPKLRITTKATVDKTDKLFELLDEILNHTKFDDTERLKELLIRHHSQVESQAKNYGVGVAMNRLTSYFKNSGMFNEMINGLTYYDFVTDLTENFETRNEEIITNLQKVASLLIKKQNLIAGITCSGENYTTYQEAFNNFVPELAEGEVSLNQWKFNLEPKNEGLLSSSLVQYVTKGYDFKKLGYEWDGKMEVLNQILSTDYLQTQIRVMGGAYGGWAQISPTGTLMFASYRDPNLTETLENYDAGAEYLQNFEADSAEMTRYIIGTIANIDNPTTASQRGSIAMNNYFKKETKEKMQQERNAILNTTAEDISGYAQMISDVMNQDIYCVYGNDQKINEHEELFEAVRQVVQ